MAPRRGRAVAGESASCDVPTAAQTIRSEQTRRSAQSSRTISREKSPRDRTAARAGRVGESETEQPAREIPTELLLDVCRDRPLVKAAILEPALEVLRDDPVERRLLGPAPLVPARRRGARVRARESPRGKRGERGDQAGTRGVAEYGGAHVHSSRDGDGAWPGWGAVSRPWGGTILKAAQQGGPDYEGRPTRITSGGRRYELIIGSLRPVTCLRGCRRPYLGVLRGTLWAWGCPCSAPVGSRAKRCRIGSPAVTCSPPGDFAPGCSGGRLGNCS